TNLMRKDLEKGIDFGVITTAMPIWLSTLNDISYIYPLQKELFDLVIIDEASQCDIASIIPVLHRAKRLVIVGDQQQLRHVSFLSLDKMIEYADIEGLNLGDDVVNFRDNSILDYALDHITSQEQICFLNEHYRSIPEIIDFSNQYFYSDALNLMTKLTFESKVGGLIWRKCDGNRMASGVNEKEAREIVQSLNKLISFEEVKDMSQCSSVAIISPFRKQVNFLKSLLSQELSLQEMKKHDIIVGTPFELQGEERTRVYVSWVIDDAVQQGTLQYLDREDVFNVTITRAKDFMINFHSFDPKKIDRKSLLFEYQAHTLNYRAEETKDHYNDEFFTEVTKSLIKLEVKDDDIIPNYRVGSYTFDIFLQKGNRKYFIDLIGFPGIQEGTFPFEQYRMLFRTRSQILAIPYTYWQFNRAACLRYIEQTLNG
ncbi:MAG: AAA domain-containing protein, partial [Flavobacteriales bacterium]|nr:AAA domain-containing protein [Flavobacteriales bacterium]